jgi:hypothetical protein
VGVHGVSVIYRGNITTATPIKKLFIYFIAEKVKHVLVSDPTEIRQFLDDPMMTNGDDYYYISVKEPDTKAIDSLMDRLLGKASTKIIGPSGKDGEEGPIQVVVANFDVGPKVLPAQVQNAIIEEAVAVSLEEEDPEDEPLHDSHPDAQLNDLA